MIHLPRFNVPGLECDGCHLGGKQTLCLCPLPVGVGAQGKLVASLLADAVLLCKVLARDAHGHLDMLVGQCVPERIHSLDIFAWVSHAQNMPNVCQQRVSAVNSYFHSTKGVAPAAGTRDGKGGLGHAFCATSQNDLGLAELDLL